MAEQPKGWTLETLFYHLNDRIEAAKEQAKLALTASDKAIAKAEIASEKRFESVNEFRAALTDASRNNITRTEVDSKIEALTEKIKDLGDRMNRSEGSKQGLIDGWKIFAALVGLLATIFAILAAMKHWQ
jgi:phage shock protein A